MIIRRTLIYGAINTAYLFLYFWQASFSADVTNLALYQMAEVFSVFLGFTIGFLIAAVECGIEWLSERIYPTHGQLTPEQATRFKAAIDRGEVKDCRDELTAEQIRKYGH
jgi:hypothetical protein